MSEGRPLRAKKFLILWVVLLLVCVVGVKWWNDGRNAREWLGRAEVSRVAGLGETSELAKVGHWEAAVGAYEKANGYLRLKGAEQKAWYGAQEKLVAARKSAVDFLLREGNEALGKRQWGVAREKLEVAKGVDAKADVIVRFAGKLEAAEVLAKKNAELAREGFGKLRGEDRGVYEGELVKKVERLVKLSPEDEEIGGFLAKIRSYPRTIRVPEEVVSLVKAVELARDGDTIRLGAGLWNEPMVLVRSVTIVGAGADQTKIARLGVKGSALLVSGDVKISGVEFRGLGGDEAVERYAVVEVAGGKVVFENCRFTGGAGHGVWVHGGAEVKFSTCVATKNGWDGWVVDHAGVGFVACEASENGSHGVSVGEGGSVDWEQGVIVRNGVNGLLVNTEEGVKVGDATLAENGEFGVVWLRGSGEVRGGLVEKNQFGGVGLRKGAEVGISSLVKGNGQADLVLEKGAGKVNAELNYPQAVIVEGADFSVPASAVPVVKPVLPSVLPSVLPRAIPVEE